jgi:hypothetical protein
VVWFVYVLHSFRRMFRILPIAKLELSVSALFTLPNNRLFVVVR